MGRFCASDAELLYTITICVIIPTPAVKLRTKYHGRQIEMERKCFSTATSICQRRHMVKKCSMRYSMIVLAGGKRESQSYCLSIPLTPHNKSAGGGVNSHARSAGNRFKNIPTLINLIPHRVSINLTRFGK